MNFCRTYLAVQFSVAAGTVELRSARGEERAVAAAKFRFARRFGFDDWSMVADQVSIVCQEGRVGQGLALVATYV